MNNFYKVDKYLYINLNLITKILITSLYGNKETISIYLLGEQYPIGLNMSVKEFFNNIKEQGYREKLSGVENE